MMNREIEVGNLLEHLYERMGYSLRMSESERKAFRERIEKFIPVTRRMRERFETAPLSGGEVSAA